MSSRPRHQTPENFWSRVAITNDDSECWLWTGSMSSTGYGVIRWGGRTLLVHRVAAWLSGLIPDPKRDPKDMSSVVMHGCDNPLCCNPNHLFPSTQSENVSEQHRKGRRNVKRGELHDAAACSDAQAMEIYKAFYSDKKTTLKEIAEAHNVTRYVVEGIVYRKRYRHIHEDEV